MRDRWTRTVLGGLLLCAVAAAGIGLNFTLLRLTSESNDPVGRLSPRAVFAPETTATRPVKTATEPVATATEPVATTPEHTETGRGDDDHSGRGGGEDD